MMDVLCSCVAGLPPPLWLCLQSGHALDVARCLLEHSSAVHSLLLLIHPSAVWELLQQELHLVPYQLCQNPLDGCSTRSYQLQASTKLIKTTNMLGNSV